MTGTTVHFSCLRCASVYRATQQARRPEKGLNIFNCSQCAAPVHSWAGSYDYSLWKLVIYNPDVGER